MLTDLLPSIRKLTEGDDLSADEAREAFITLEEEDVECYYYFTFLAALHTKGETAAELLGFCQANEHFVPPFSLGADTEPVLDVSGTGGDRLKTANVSTAAAFIVASAGVPVVKQSFLAVTGLTGSANILQAFGVDPLGMSREGPETLRRVFARTGMLAYHANSMARPDQRRGYFSFWLDRVPATRLGFVTAYHLAANVYSPIPMRRRVYGVFDSRFLEPLAQLFAQLKYDKALIVHGLDGLDEVSNIGPTRILELQDGDFRSYAVTPEELGLPVASAAAVQAASSEGNVHDFVRILFNRDSGAKRDLVLANAAAGLYIADKVKTLREGVDLARALVEDGSAGRQLENYVAACGDKTKLQEIRSAALSA